MRRLALAALLWTSASAAKSVSGPELDEADPIAVRARLEGTTARMSVDFRVATTRESSASVFELPLPDGAVVAGATITHAGVRHRMALDSTEKTEARFSAAFGEATPGARANTWLAKIDLSPNGLLGAGVSMTIGTPTATELLVTIEVAAPTCFFRDARWVRLPGGWQRPARATTPTDSLIAACADPDDPRADGAWKSFAAPAAARLPSGDRVLASTARLGVDHELHLARTELALAKNIADIPRDLATVILVDESRSMTDAQREAQREIVLGYLRAAPNTRVQVLAFSRRTRALLPAWTIASRARSRLERELASMSPRNGSNFDLGLAHAGRLLSAIRGTRRVVLVTDEAMASRLGRTPETLAKLVPEGTIINVAVAGTANDGDELSRHDGARLARLAATTTGFSTLLGELDPQRRASVDASMLVRPISLDRIQTTGLGWTDLDESSRESLGGVTCRGSLAAGQSCVWWTRGTKFAGTIQLEGLLWNRHVVRLVRPLGDPGHTIAREIVATGTTIVDDRHDVEGNETMTSTRIDALARAVTTTTSLFVRWGGTIPLAESTLTGGMFGFGRSGRIGHFTDTRGPPMVPVPNEDLTPQLRPLVASCGLGTTRVDIKIELTFQEIVDVDVSIAATGAHAAAIRSCVEDAVWDLTPALATLRPLRNEHIVL